MASTTKKFSYKLVKTGSVLLTASTDLRGYVVGQVLRLQADIENQSGKDTSPVVASLLQVRAIWIPEPVLSHPTAGVVLGLPRLTVKSFLRRYPTRPSAGSMTSGPLQKWRVVVSRPGGVLSGKNRSSCLPCPSRPCPAAALSTSTITFRFGVAQGWVA